MAQRKSSSILKKIKTCSESESVAILNYFLFFNKEKQKNAWKQMENEESTKFDLKSTQILLFLFRLQIICL